MPVNSTHSEYDRMSPAWAKARDVIAGECAIKSAGEKYVPRLEGQENKDFDAYVNRGEFFNATARTLDGLVGSIFRKDPTIQYPDSGTIKAALDAFKDDCDMFGTPIFDYARDVTREVLSVARAGTLIDWEGISEQRAYFARYKAEDIINWKMERFGGKMHLALVALKECVQVADPTDPFSEVYEDRIRVLELVATKATPTGPGALEYHVTVWKRIGSGKDEKWVIESSVVPVRKGKPLNFIPFVFHGPKNSMCHCEKLPLEDIIAVNLSHWRTNVDWKHGLHFTALPTAWVAGFEKSTTLKLGAATAWVSDDPNATAGFLEFTGQGLQALVDAQDKDEKHMAVLGARLLEEQKKEAETAEAMHIRQSGEGSILAEAATAISQSLTRALKIVQWWNGTEAAPEAIKDETTKVELNRDFFTQRMPIADAQALVAMWQSQAISRETLFWNMQNGEIIPPGRTLEEELALIDKEPPPMMVPAKIEPIGGDDDEGGKEKT